MCLFAVLAQGQTPVQGLSLSSFSTILFKMRICIQEGVRCAGAAKDLAAISEQFPFEPLEFLPKMLRITFAEGIKMLNDAGHQVTWPVLYIANESPCGIACTDLRYKANNAVVFINLHVSGAPGARQ